MSLFLGKVHYDLYNKILWFEGLEEKIIENIKSKDISIDDLLKHINQHFGEPVGNKSLEEVIDTSNIHGWLQNRIENAELRHAALITELLTWNPNYKSELIIVFLDQGAKAAHAYTEALKDSKIDGSIEIKSAPEIYQVLNEYILEGMPCDRVNEIIKNKEEDFIWVTTTCLHRPYWEKVGGDVNNFHTLRETWISAFVSTINPNFKYEKTANGMNRISKLEN